MGNYLSDLITNLLGSFISKFLEGTVASISPEVREFSVHERNVSFSHSGGFGQSGCLHWDRRPLVCCCSEQALRIMQEPSGDHCCEGGETDDGKSTARRSQLSTLPS